MTHVSVDVGENTVASPGRHENSKGDGESSPVFGPEVCLGWLAKTSWGVRFYQAVDDYGDDDSEAGEDSEDAGE